MGEEVQALERADMFFTVAFTVELCVNMYAHWCRTFFRDGW